MIAAAEPAFAPHTTSTRPLVAPMTPAERATIDASTRGPVLFFLGNSILWLLVATLLGFITSLQLYRPTFLADYPFLTYGRLWPAYQNIITYGWASLSGMGVAIWLMARLTRIPVRYAGVLVAGALLWQIGLTFGIGSILGGNSSGVEWLEIPTASAVLMLIGYALVGLWGILLYGLRKESAAYISVWYLLAAFLWFPWVFATAHLTKSFPQLGGVVQNIIGAWASQSFYSVWVTAVGLATAYYLIPKVINRPIHSYNVATAGFWTFIIFAGLTGATRLSGGPIPAWLVSLSIAANILLIVQIVTVAVNLVSTIKGEERYIYHSPTVRFTYFGVIAFLIASVLGLFSSLRSIDAVLHFTPFLVGLQQLIIYGFFSMVIFGAIYYILPRLVGCEWLSSSLITFHFYGAAYGGSMVTAMFLISGLATGIALSNPETTFAQVIDSASLYVAGRALAWVLVGIGHLIFALHFGLMLLRIGQPGGQPTLFGAHGEEAH